MQGIVLHKEGGGAISLFSAAIWLEPPGLPVYKDRYGKSSLSVFSIIINQRSKEQRFLTSFAATEVTEFQREMTKYLGRKQGKKEEMGLLCCKSTSQRRNDP